MDLRDIRALLGDAQPTKKAYDVLNGLFELGIIETGDKYDFEYN